MTAGTTRDPATVGPYRLVRKLGEGGMGVVHLALDPAGRAVALKVLRAHVANDDEARRRLAREVATLRRVRHPQVAEVLDADVAGEQPYLVTRFVPGRSLEDVVRSEGPRNAGQVARIGRDLAGALAQIHAVGVVHRDLKPANVMMIDDEPVLIDFGIAHVADESRITRTGLVMGTPGYLSPELIYGDPVTPATDWWAWGATLAFAATGRQPFGSGPIEVILERVRRGASDLDGVEPRLRTLLTRTLTVDPGARPSAMELHAALDDVVRGVTTAPSDERERPTARQVLDPTVRTTPPTAHQRAEPYPAPSGRRVRAPEPAVTPAPAPPRPSPPPPPVAYPPAPPSVPAPTAPYPYPPYAPPAAGHPYPGQPPAYPAPPQPSYPAGQPYPPPARPYPPPQPATPYGGTSPRADAAPRRVTGPLAAAMAALCLLAAVAPGGAMVVAVLVGVVARTVQRSADGLQRRRAELGRSRTDVAVTVAALPWRLVTAVLVSLVAAVLPTLVAVSAAFITGTAISRGAVAHPSRPLPLVVGMAAAVATAWWGPGGWGLRAGTRAIARTVTAQRGGQIAVFAACALVALSVLLVLGQGAVPDWTPFTPPRRLAR